MTDDKDETMKEILAEIDAGKDQKTGDTMSPEEEEEMRKLLGNILGEIKSLGKKVADQGTEIAEIREGLARKQRRGSSKQKRA